MTAPSEHDRIALAKSVLGHAEGHEKRAVDEALLALDGATIDDLATLREMEEG